MKKILAILLSAMLLLTMAACVTPTGQSTTPGTSAAEEAAEDDAQEETAASDFKFALVIGVGGLGDGSFNDSMKEGADMAKEALGCEYQLIEPKEVAEFEGHFTELSASGEYDLIVGGGFDAIDAMTKVATEFPDQKYLFVDGAVEGCDNVTSVTYRDNEKAYLLGIMAAMETKTNKLGIVLALDIDSLRVFSSGFMAGAYSVNPDLDIEVKIVGGFADTTTAKELALALKEEGCDLIYVAAGGSGLGCFAAAKEAGGFRCLGVDVNQCLIEPDVVMASGMRLLQNTVSNGVQDAAKDALVGGHHSEGLKEDALTFTVEGSNCPPSEEAVAAAEAAMQDIIDGKITVPSTYEEVGYGE